MDLEFLTDAAAFLDAASAYFEERPVVSAVPAGVASRFAAGDDEPQSEDWFVLVREGAELVGIAMRTAHFGPRPAYVLPMPPAGALLLARTLYERGETLPAVTGSLPATRLIAEELARLTGGVAAVERATRLFELGTLVPPAPVPGRLRAATPGDADLVADWFEAFQLAGDEQAGRPPRASGHGRLDEADVRRRIDSGRVLFWDVDGEAVSMIGVAGPDFTVTKIGPVYTPPEHRARGYASAAVAEVSAEHVAAGNRVCLFTDQANPVSNGIYVRLGYEPVVDMAEYVVISG